MSDTEQTEVAVCEIKRKGGEERAYEVLIDGGTIAIFLHRNDAEFFARALVLKIAAQCDGDIVEVRGDVDTALDDFVQRGIAEDA